MGLSSGFRHCAFYRTALAALFAAMTASPALATLYKCAQDGGQVIYQDSPCPAGRELRDFDKDPATVSVVPFGQPPATTGKSSNKASSKNAAAPRNGARIPAENGKPAGDNGKRESSAKKSAQSGDATKRKFLAPGIGEGEVVARIGRPDMTSKGGKGTTQWTYMPVPEDASTITTLSFEHGRLVQVERKVVR
jgi:Domain of unknown function (DUF4124)